MAIVLMLRSGIWLRGGGGGGALEEGGAAEVIIRSCDCSCVVEAQSGV